MSSVVAGTLSPFTGLSNITDWTSVKKVCQHSMPYANPHAEPLYSQYHKLNGELALKTISKDSEQEHLVVTEIVTSSVAMKSVMA